MTDRPLDGCRVTVVCLSDPFGKADGGVEEMRRRHLRLRESGCAVDLVTLGPLVPVPSPGAQLYDKRCSMGHAPRTSRSTVTSVWTPRPAQRVPRDIEGVVRELPRPEAVLAESIFVVSAAVRLAQHWGVPLHTRLHNIEQEYFSELARSSSMTMFRVAPRSWLTTVLARREALVLRRWERSTLSQLPGTIHPVSTRDTQTLREWGIADSRLAVAAPIGSVLVEPSPPRPTTQPSTGAGPDRASSVLAWFPGSLRVPQNFNALEWFVSAVVPLLRVPPAIEVTGAPPGARARRWFEARGVRFTASQPETPVLVGICPMRRGAGTSMKTLDLLTTGIPVVATPKALRGIAVDVRQTASERGSLFEADTPTAFADGVERAHAYALRELAPPPNLSDGRTIDARSGTGP